MRAVTIGQVLNHVEAFEDMLTDFYRTCSEENPHEGVRLLTEYMSRHSHHMRDLISKFPDEDVSGLLTLPLTYEPHFPDSRCFEEIDLAPDADAAEVLDAAVMLDEHLLQLYRQTIEKTVDHRIREFFETLMRVIEQDEIQLKKIKAMNYF